MKFGFSAVELLLVAGIISILVAMSVPGYLEMKVRAEIADVKVAMNAATSGLYQYQINFGQLPEPPSFNNFNPIKRLPLTQSMDNDPVDRFKNGLKGYGFYYSDPLLNYDYLDASPFYARMMANMNINPSRKSSKNNWFLRSIGPDQTDYRDEGRGRNSTNMNINGVVEYNPTNGVFSLGDITNLSQ